MTGPDLIIDCDPGHDDAIAILLAHKHAHVLAITTVSGNAPLAHTTANALALLDIMHADIPVYGGADRPLHGTALHAEHVHGPGGFAGVSLPVSARRPAGTNAAATLVAAARDTAGLWLVAIGPLTNVALAIQQDHEFVRRLAGISIMGGSTGSGNATPVAEFNILADPEAARIVFGSGARIRLCGLNLTRQLTTDDDWVAQLQRGGEAARLAAGLYTHMHDRIQTLTGVRRAPLHDPCAVLAVTHPHLLQFEDLHVDVELNGELTRGMTVVDQRPTLDKAPANAAVATHIESSAGRSLITNALMDY